MHKITSARQVAESVLSYVKSDNYAGYDPFDLLNSNLLRSSPLFKSEFIRLLWLQFGKRCPINFRIFLGVPKMRNPKGIGLFISGLLEDHRRTGDICFLTEARELAAWLLTQRNQGEWQSHACWGYHFDWQARAFYVPAGKPNIITTCYVARALYDLGIAVNDSELISTALDAAYFIAKNLYTEIDGRRFYAYIPGETAFVHNASLWGSAWCAFAGTQLGDQSLVDQALVVARQSSNEQADDGSWVYGARPHHQFIDGFHTGYNLQALNILRNTLNTNEFDSCIKQGFRYYKAAFFTTDGTAKYYNNSVYPLDMHSFAQAVFTLLDLGGSAEDWQLCDKVVQRGIELMYLQDKNRFLYQRTRWFTNRINYTRWTQAWAYAALAFYNRKREELKHAQN